MQALLKTAQGWVEACSFPEEAEALELDIKECNICEDIKVDFIAPLAKLLTK